MTASRNLPTLLSVALVAGGCTVGPRYQPPEPPQVDQYVRTPVTLPSPGPTQPEQRLIPNALVEDRWWEAFGSHDLNTVVDRALAASPTLVTARGVLGQARETLIAARGGYYPQLDVAASASRQNRLAGQLAVTSGRIVSDIYSVGPVVTFPLDIFGGVRSTVEQRSAEVDVQRAELGAARLSLVGNVLTQAITIASISAQLTAVDEIIAIDERNLELAKISAEAGKSAQLDVLSATSQLASDRTLLPPLRQQRDAAVDALSVLTGAPPATWTAPDFQLQALTLLQDLPVTLPSELVRRRPDILAAEAQLRAANAAIGVAAAQLYPSVTLSGSWSREATRGAGLLDTTVNLWDIAANLTAPLFHGGTLRAQRRAAMQAYVAQLGTYQQTLLQAFGQVADVLHALEHDAELLSAQRAALEASQASLQLTQEGYQAGQATLLQVLDAERLFQQARLGYARAQGQRYLDTVQLFVAMGGGTPIEPP